MNTTLEEHLEYLSDSRRLEKFTSAIDRTIRSGDLVADVGCGFGILGILCLRAGADRVWGIDSTDAIEVARETLSRAGLADRYHTIRDHSFRASLCDPVDVIVCDHVGHFGIDYNIIKVLRDAQRRFLKVGGQIMPQRIKLNLAGASSPDCREKLEVWSSSNVPPEFHWLRQISANAKRSHSFTADEIVTTPVALGTVDLRSENPAHFSFEARLQANRDAVLDGLVGWFEAELADDIWMTNSPLADDKIDRDQAFFPFEKPIEIRAGDMVDAKLTIRHDEMLMSWSINIAETGERQRQSNWKGLIPNMTLVGNRADRVVHLNPAGKARQLVLGYVDGRRKQEEIVQAVSRDHPTLFPSTEEIRSFVSYELARSTK